MNIQNALEELHKKIGVELESRRELLSQEPRRQDVNALHDSDRFIKEAAYTLANLAKFSSDHPTP